MFYRLKFNKETKHTVAKENLKERTTVKRNEKRK